MSDSTVNKRNRKNRILMTVAIAGFSILLLKGCGFLNSVNLHNHKNISTGRELMDLQEAKEKKALSDEDYLKMREKIVKQESGDKK